MIVETQQLLTNPPAPGKDAMGRTNSTRIAAPGACRFRYTYNACPSAGGVKGTCWLHVEAQTNNHGSRWVTVCDFAVRADSTRAGSHELAQAHTGRSSRVRRHGENPLRIATAGADDHSLADAEFHLPRRQISDEDDEASNQ